MSNKIVLSPIPAAKNHLGIELYWDEASGIIGTSQRGAATLLGIAETTLRNRLNKGAQETESLEAEILTDGGLQGARVLTAESLFVLACDYKPELAKLMGKAGAALFLLESAGLKVKVQSPEAPKPVPLPPTDVRLKNYTDALGTLGDMFGSDFISNPRLAQYFKDAAVNIVLPEGGVAALPVSRWCGAAEIAESLGVSPSVIRRRGSALGRHVAAWYRREGREPSRESRLVNGQQRQVMVYEDTPELRDVVANYFSN
jgi:hypothetical protein